MAAPTPSVVVHPGAELLAETVSARLLTALVDAQATGRVPHWVLTGGTIADAVHRAMAASPARDAVDWSRVELWWGDERFVAGDDPERNERQARDALLDRLPVDPTRVHPMPTPADAGDDPGAAAEVYARQLAQAAASQERVAVPAFDIVMLGVGPDGHVASLFPGQTVLGDERTVTGVHDSPKPPPRRVTLTMSALRQAREVWFVVSGEAKARAVHLALSGADVVQTPAAGPRGSDRTLWLLDRPAASHL
ncbi:MAG: 6-phosphogluconolactonase [Nocardioidaceae bacterium]